MKSNMKKIFKTLGVMLAATLSLTNCTEELKNAPVAEQDRSYSIYAEQVETRTTNDGLSTKWAKGDSVNVFYADAGYLNYSENSKFVLADAETGLFETDYLKGNLSAVNDWFVLYPYNENIYSPANTSSGYLPVGAKAADVQIQIYKDNMKHIAGENYPMWGTALAVPYEEAPHVVMSHLSSLLEINVTNNTEEAIAVNSVTFMAPEDITGTYYIDITGDQPYYTSSGANYVSGVARLAVGGADQIAPGESGKFYLAIKPFTAQANTELILDVNGQTKYIYLDNDVTFSAGKIKTLNFDYTQAVEVEAGPYTSNMIWELGSKAYDHAATINGTPDVPVLKLGTSELPGTASIYVPGDAVKIGFYAVSWNEKPAVVALKKGSSIKSYFGAPVNENASGNSPYELTVNDKVSYYEMVLPESVSADCVLTTIGDNTRVIIWGLNYYTEDGIGEDQVIADPEKVTVAEFVEAEEDATLYELTGTIESVSNTKYGNFYLTDDSGSVYIYGLVDEAGAYIFSSLELKEGDVLTVVGRRASYNGNPQMVDALYISHEVAEAIEPGVDVLTRAFTGSTGTSYADWTKGSNSSAAEYVGNTAGGNESVQMRSSKNSGIVTSSSGGYVASVSVVWNENTAADRTLQVYGSSSAYSTPADLYDATTQGTLIGEIVNGTSTELVVEGDYEYIGLRSKNGAMYLSEIKITWSDTPVGGGSTDEPDEPSEPSDVTSVTIAEFLEAEVDPDVWYELTGEIINIANPTYGNFTIKDETAEVYIYGMTNGWVGSNDKSFDQIGLKVGDIVTLATVRGDYKGTPQGGGTPVPAYYISHVAGEEPEPEPEPEDPGQGGEAGEYDPQNVTWTLGNKAYDNNSTGNNTMTATVNGVAVSNLLKLGTGSAVGDATLHVPAGTTKLGFYCVAWKDKKAQLMFSVDATEVITIEPAANVGATGNPPFTLTLSDSDYYEVALPEGTTDVYIETLDPSNGRVLIIGLTAITD